MYIDTMMKIRLDLALLLSNYLYIGKKLEIDAARRFCPELKGKILDIGCGTKPFKSLLDKDSLYIGMEYSGLTQRPDLFGDANRLPFKDMSFDGVLLNEVIEHMPDPSKGIEEAYRVLKKDGKLFLTAPMYWRLHYAPQDYFRFTQYGLRHILTKGNFQVLQMERMGGFFSIVFLRLIDIFVTKILFSLMGLLFIRRGKYRLAALLMCPFSFIGYCLGRLLDNIDNDDAFLFAALAVKR